LHVACANEAPLDVIQSLVEMWPHAVKVKQKEGMLPLHIACRYNAPLDVIKSLVKSWPQSIHAMHDGGGTPLECAKERDDIRIVSWLEAEEIFRSNRCGERLEPVREAIDDYDDVESSDEGRLSKRTKRNVSSFEGEEEAQGVMELDEDSSDEEHVYKQERRDEEQIVDSCSETEDMACGADQDDDQYSSDDKEVACEEQGDQDLSEDEVVVFDNEDSKEAEEGEPDKGGEEGHLAEGHEPDTAGQNELEEDYGEWLAFVQSNGGHWPTGSTTPTQLLQPLRRKGVLTADLSKYSVEEGNGSVIAACTVQYLLARHYHPDLVEAAFGVAHVRAAVNLRHNRETTLKVTRDAVPLQMKDDAPKMVCAVLAVLQHRRETEEKQLAFIKLAKTAELIKAMQALINAMQSLPFTDGPDLLWAGVVLLLKRLNLLTDEQLETIGNTGGQPHELDELQQGKKFFISLYEEDDAQANLQKITLKNVVGRLHISLNIVPNTLIATCRGLGACHLCVHDTRKTRSTCRGGTKHTRASPRKTKTKRRITLRSTERIFWFSCRCKT
jgi:hypothetical protein